MGLDLRWPALGKGWLAIELGGGWPEPDMLLFRSPLEDGTGALWPFIIWLGIAGCKNFAFQKFQSRQVWSDDRMYFHGFSAFRLWWIRRLRNCSYRWYGSLPLEVRQWWRIVSHICEHQPLFVVVFAKDLVFAEVESVAYAKPGTNRKIVTFSFKRLLLMEKILRMRLGTF